MKYSYSVIQESDTNAFPARRDHGYADFIPGTDADTIVASIVREHSDIMTRRGATGLSIKAESRGIVVAGVVEIDGERARVCAVRSER